MKIIFKQLIYGIVFYSSSVLKDEKMVMIMGRKLKDFFTIPSDILPEFWHVAFNRNRISLLVICIMILGMELFNMARVLLWSSSGLGTLNNRIYFGFYCSLFVVAAIYLLFAYLPKARRPKRELVLQYGSVLFFLLWHVSINSYDLMRDANAEIGIYYTAILGISIFILMTSKLAVIMYLSAYVLFMILAGGILSSGDRINITFTSIVAFAVSVTNCHHYATNISQRMEISKMNEKLQILAQRDALTGLLNKAAFEHCAESHLQREGVVLLIADLDNFKSVNDLYGHPCGDFVLKETALSVEAAFPDAIGVSRIGGDEFAVLLNPVDESYLKEKADSLISSISKITWHGIDVSSGCSIGGCRIGANGVSFGYLYAKTDKALYRAKAEGKGRFFLTKL